MEDHITSDRDLLVTFLTNLRSWYEPVLFSDKREQASVDKTLLGIIDEVWVRLSVCLHILHSLSSLHTGYQLLGCHVRNVAQERLAKGGAEYRLQSGAPVLAAHAPPPRTNH